MYVQYCILIILFNTLLFIIRYITFVNMTMMVNVIITLIINRNNKILSQNIIF